MTHHDPASTSPGYEVRDAQPRWLLVGGALLVVLIAVAFVLVAGIDRGLTAQDARADEPPHPMASFRRAPSTAALQAAPKLEYEEFAARERELLSSYGWVDPAEGVVRLPIERAMELLLERGLPAPPAVEEAGE